MEKKAFYKIILLGDPDVGKSSIFSRQIDDYFDPFVKPSSGIIKKNISLKVNENIFDIYISDTAGQERYRSMMVSYFKAADGIILVYDITNKDSFDHLKQWYKQIKANAKKDIPILLAGNKKDLSSSSRQVLYEDGLMEASNNQALFKEVSSKTGENIQGIFEDLMLKIVETQTSYVIKDINEKTNNKSFSLEEKRLIHSKKKKCC